jgi:hypothetical protein
MPPETPRPPEGARKEFLLKMYDQMFNDINTHILVVWQSVGVMIGAFAIFALAEKGVLSIDVATTLIVLIASWLLAHLQDASYWYNRNLVIIANIERQFLVGSDLRDIHYYFGAHRPNRMISHLKIQYAFGVSMAFIMLLLHFITRVVPGWSGPMSNSGTQRTLPYVVSIGAGIYLARLARRRRAAYAEFVRNSPGAAVNPEGITYGVGHGFLAGERAEASPTDAAKTIDQN